MQNLVHSTDASEQFATSVYDVLVVGGGLGGLALAVGLGHLDGLSWLLAEAADELRTETGTLIGLGNNGLVALDALDRRIVPELRKVAQPGTIMAVHHRPENSTQPAKVTSTPFPDKSILHTVRWAATQSVLARLVDPNRVLCGHKCTGYTEQPDGLMAVHFKGKPDIRARFVVGADGLRSAVCKSLCPEDPGPRFLGYMNWNAVRHVPGSSSAPGSHTITNILDGRPFSTLVYLINAGCDYQFWQVRLAVDEPCFTNGLSGGAGVPGSKARLLAHFRELGWQDVVKEIEATDESLIFERALWDRLPLACWSGAGGKVVLIGDAAHAMYPGPGQGARNAFEDAHQLFEAIKQRWPNTQAVAQQYQDARLLRGTVIQNWAASTANLKALAQDINAFWEHLAPEVTGMEARDERGKAFQEWINSYPDHVHGVPGSRYTSPAVLKAFVEHCAVVTAQHKESCLHMEVAKVF